MKCTCGATVPLGNKSSLCDTCLGIPRKFEIRSERTDECGECEHCGEESDELIRIEGGMYCPECEPEVRDEIRCAELDARADYMMYGPMDDY
jgi:hypothetical protein